MWISIVSCPFKTILLTFLSLVIIFVVYVFVRALMLNRNREFRNVHYSAVGVPLVVHFNESKTVTDSINGARKTLDEFGINDFDLNSFYKSLNRKNG